MTDNGVKTGQGKHIFAWIVGTVVALIIVWASVLFMENRNPMAGIPMPPPSPPMPNPNAFDYYLNANGALGPGIYDISIKASEAVNNPNMFGDLSLAEKKLMLENGHKANELVHQGFSYPCQTERPSPTTFPQYGRIRNLARYLHFESRVKAEMRLGRRDGRYY